MNCITSCLIATVCTVQAVHVITVLSLPSRCLALTSLRLLFLLAAGLAVVVCVDTWRHKIWPLIGGDRSCPSWIACAVLLLCFLIASCVL